MKGILISVVLTAAVSFSVHAGEWNVLEAGAVPDGKTDCTAVFQRLLDEAGEARGGVVHVPAGRYLFEGNLRIPGGVTLQGTYRVAPTVHRRPWSELEGTVLLPRAGRGTREGPPFISLAGPAATLAGVVIYYPDWSPKDLPPVPYPPCVKGERYSNLGVVDCCFVNPYEAMVFQWGRIYVRNVTGQPIYRGLYVDMCRDVGRVENVHFWPFSVIYKPDDPYSLWINTNGIAFEFARTDWQYVLNTFCFGYGVGYKFSESENGHCNGNFVGIGADCCRRPILVEQCRGTGLLITNGEFVGRWTSNDSVGLEIGPDVSGKVSLVNCTFFGTLDRAIWQRGRLSQLSVMGTHFDRWDTNADGVGAVHIDAGRAIVQGNTFDDGHLPVYVGPEAKSAILIGNQAVSGFRVESHAGERTQLVGNQQHNVTWNEDRLRHYRVDLGVEGDDLYLRKWHGPNPDVDWGVPDKSMRWSGDDSEFILPVIPNIAYTVSLELQVPEHAASTDRGIFLGEERILGLPVGDTTVIQGALPPQTRSPVTLTLRCRSWVPRKHKPESRDARPLGVAVRSITMRAKGADGEPFNANGGP